MALRGHEGIELPAARYRRGLVAAGVCLASVFVLSSLASAAPRKPSPAAHSSSTPFAALAAPRSFAVGGLAEAIALSDLNGDGRADLVVAGSRTRDLSVLIGNGNGTFASAVRYPSAPCPSRSPSET